MCHKLHCLWSSQHTWQQPWRAGSPSSCTEFLTLQCSATLGTGTQMSDHTACLPDDAAQSVPERSFRSTTVQRRQSQPRSCTPLAEQCGPLHSPCESFDGHYQQRQPCPWGGRRCHCRHSPWLLWSRSPQNTAQHRRLLSAPTTRHLGLISSCCVCCEVQWDA